MIDYLRSDMVAMIRKRGVAPSDYEDSVQECVVCVMDCIEARPREFLRYCRAALRNTLNGFVGRRRLLPSDCEEVTSREDVHSRNVQEAEDFLAALPSGKRRLVEMYYGIGCREMSINQLAGMLGVGWRAVRRELAESLVMMSKRV